MTLTRRNLMAGLALASPASAKKQPEFRVPVTQAQASPGSGIFETSEGGFVFAAVSNWRSRRIVPIKSTQVPDTGEIMTAGIDHRAVVSFVSGDLMELDDAEFARFLREFRAWRSGSPNDAPR